MSHTSPCAQIASTNHRHHLAHSLCPCLPCTPPLPHPDGYFSLARASCACKPLTSKCIHAPSSVALDSLAPLDSLSPCLFRSHPGRTQNTSLFLLSETRLAPPNAAPLSLFLSPFFFFFFLHFCARVFPTPPTLARSSSLQLSARFLSPLPLFLISPPTPPPLPPPAFTNFRLPFSFHLVRCHSLYPPVNISPPFILHPLLALLTLSSLLPHGVGSLWLLLSGLWISVLPPEIYSVCAHAVQPSLLVAVRKFVYGPVFCEARLMPLLLCVFV